MTFPNARRLADAAALLELLPLPDRTHVQLEHDQYDGTSRTQVTAWMYDGFTTEEVDAVLDDERVDPTKIFRGQNAWIESALSDGAELTIFVRDDDVEHYSRTHNILIEED